MLKAIFDMVLATRSNKTIVPNQIVHNIISTKLNRRFITRTQHKTNVDKVLKYKF